MTPLQSWLLLGGTFAVLFAFTLACVLIADRYLPDPCYQPASVRTQNGVQSMADTHYIPAFTEVRNGTQRTVCGAYVTFRAHSPEPTCPECAAWLAGTEGQDYLRREAEADADFERMVQEAQS